MSKKYVFAQTIFTHFSGQYLAKYICQIMEGW